MVSRNSRFSETSVAAVLFLPIRWILACCGLLIALLCAAWFIDCVFVTKVWPAGLQRLQEITRDELAAAMRQSDGCYKVPEYAVRAANGLYDAIFVATGIHQMGTRFADGAALSIPDTIVRNTYVANYLAIQAAMTGTQLFGIKLAELLAFIPILSLLYLVAAADGLVERAIRRSCGGQESSGLYHRAKYWQLRLLGLVSASWLVLPGTVDARSILIPGILLLALSARWQWMYYKKYL